MKFIITTIEDYLETPIDQQQKPLEDERVKLEEVEVIDPLTKERYHPKRKWVVDIDTLEELLELKEITGRELHIKSTHLNANIPVLILHKVDYVHENDLPRS